MPSVFDEADFESDPILSPLNPDQRSAVTTLLRVISQTQAERESRRGGWVALLTGPAGSGKTFTLAALIKCTVRQHQIVNKLMRARGATEGFLPERFRVLVPTHEAKRVLLDALLAAGVPSTQFIIQTVAAFLSKRPDVENPPPQEGRATPGFASNPGSAVEALRTDIALVVDEVSMLSEEDIRAIKAKAHDAELAVLLTGDFAQIPPVGHPSIRKKLAAVGTHIHLSRVERNHGDILRIASAVRTDGDFDPGAFANATDVTLYTDAAEWLRTYCRHADTPVAVAYRNTVVNALADRRRKHLLGAAANNPFNVDEAFRLASPVTMEVQTGRKTMSVCVMPSSARVVVTRTTPAAAIVDPVSGVRFDAHDLTIRPRDTSELTPAALKQINLGADFKGDANVQSDGSIDILAVTPATAASPAFKRAQKAREAVARYIEGWAKQKHQHPEIQWLLHANRSWPGVDQALARGAIWDITAAPNGLRAALDEGRIEYGTVTARQGADGPVRTLLVPHLSHAEDPSTWVNRVRRWAWRALYFGWSSRFVTLASPHARTAHTAQGSTHKVVFVHARDIRRASADKRALLYVALSRASEHLHVLT